ncbi:MAG: hypothetical protein BECKG1743F_GA0114225_110962 [Candidatus Kentron sp. G]|nr:MAG: hypothetical protein BECKG1743F_GA0114225_110962 [Candidatus Kentron sp. G]
MVRVAAPPELDREQIHARALREKELERKLLEADYRARETETKYLMQKGHTDDLKDLFGIVHPGNIHINNAPGGSAVNSTHTQTITGSTIIGSTLNQGTIHGRLTNLARNIGTLPAAEAGTKANLEALLGRLAETLKDAPPAHREDAENLATLLETAVAYAEAGKKSLIKDTGEHLKKYAHSLSEYSPSVLQCTTEILKLLGR